MLIETSKLEIQTYRRMGIPRCKGKEISGIIEEHEKKADGTEQQEAQYTIPQHKQ